MFLFLDELLVRSRQIIPENFYSKRLPFLQFCFLQIVPREPSHLPSKTHQRAQFLKRDSLHTTQYTCHRKYFYRHLIPIFTDKTIIKPKSQTLIISLDFVHFSARQIIKHKYHKKMEKNCQQHQRRTGHGNILHHCHHIGFHQH